MNIATPIEILLGLLVAPVTCCLLYVGSLRRTEPKEREFWRVLTFGGSLLGILLGLGTLHASGTNEAGRLAIILVPTWLLLICALGVEIDNMSRNGVHDWRQKQVAARPKAAIMWEVIPVMVDESDNVEIRIYRGEEFYRLSGTIDPIVEGADAYQDLLAQANEQAGMLNALGIKVLSGKALARR